MSTTGLIASDATPSWQDRANCHGVPTDYFYPEKGDRTDAAKAVCRRCEVRPECLEWSLENREPYGVWGGISEPERRRLLASPITPLGCDRCGVPRRRHDATDHTYQVPDMPTVLARAAELKKTRRAAA